MKTKHIIIMLLAAISLSSCGIYVGPRGGYYGRPHYNRGYHNGGYYHYGGMRR